MKIREIRAFLMKDNVGSAYSVSDADMATARRRPWMEGAEVANPMSRYPRYKALRSSWMGELPNVGCVVIADNGEWGFSTTQQGGATVSLINDALGKRLVGENPLATERLYDMMLRMASPYSSSGLGSYAISAIDLALWDLKGRSIGMPVYELAGGPARETQFCYATGNDTDWHMELGFKATKLACPYGAADGLAAINKNDDFVGKARELIGPDIELMLDCWMAFDVEFAVRLAERLRPHQLRWIEDCLTPEDMGAHRQLRQRLPWQTLTSGEHWYTAYTFLEAASDRVVDIFQPDIHWAGGFTACQRISHIAEAAGIEVMLHAGMNTPYGQHFVYSNPNSTWGEYFVGGAPGVPLEKTIGFPGLKVPKDGYCVPSDAPGFGHGYSLDDIEALRR
jgi:L-rhamnonate dehydratase